MNSDEKLTQVKLLALFSGFFGVCEGGGGGKPSANFVLFQMNQTFATRARSVNSIF